ncbi:MAG: isochorismatase family protein [Fimbriimonadaceae bacterium]|nr:isochorismatase family protein [Fimbriimonadaceae bacterium]
MKGASFRPEGSIVFLVDVQTGLRDVIADADRVIRRGAFLLECAHRLNISVRTTEQYPERLGATVPELLPFAGEIRSKREFSAAAGGGLLDRNRHIVVLGVETHICVYWTVRDLIEAGHQVTVVSDATSARTVDRHEEGLAAMRHLGAQTLHSETVVYGWMATSTHEAFRDVLALVKGSDGG